MRRDAAENQERVLAAAVVTMLREGHHVPMAVIAAEAGVGVGTLYRKYPNRTALLQALTERAFGLLASLIESVLDGEGTGLEKLDRFWDLTIDEHDQLVLPLGGGPPELTPGAQAGRRRLNRGQRRIVEIGIADGSIRDDTTLTDVIHFGAMLVAPFAGDMDWPAVARRQKDIHLAGLAGPAARR